MREVEFITWFALLLIGGGGVEDFFYPPRGGAKHFFAPVRGGANAFFKPLDRAFISASTKLMQTPLVLSLGTHWNRLGCYVWLGLIRFVPWGQLGQVRLLGQVRFGSLVARGW